MKLALLMMDGLGLNVGGTLTFALHLRSKLRKKGWDVDIIAPTVSGKKHKGWIEEDNFNFKYFVCKFKDLADKLKNYNVVHINNGIAKCKDYSFLGKIKRLTLMEHSNGTDLNYYNYPKLFEQYDVKSTFGYNRAILEKYRPYVWLGSRMDIVHRIFDKDLLDLSIKSVVTYGGKKFIYPHKMRTVRRQKDVINEILEMNIKVPWKMHFYGYGSEMYFYHGGFKHLFDEHDYLVLEEPYLPTETKDIFTGVDLSFHSCELKKIPMGNDFEYTALESIHYGVPVVIRENLWVNDLEECKRNKFIRHSTYIPFEENSINRYFEDEVYRNHIKNCMLNTIQLHASDKYINEFIKVWEDQI